MASFAAWADPSRRMTLAPGDAVCFAFVSVENRKGLYNAVEVLDTEHGPVSVAYRTVGGHNATDDDEVFVMLLPERVIAVPMQMTIPDGDTGRICLREYLGG